MTKFKNILNFWRRKEFFKDKLVIFFIVLAFLLNMVGWGIIYIKIKPSEIPFTLLYNIYLGVIFLGSWYKLYTLPGLGLILVLVNLGLSYIIYPREKTASYFLLAGTVLVQILILIGIAALVLINV